MMFADYHTHTVYSDDSVYPMEELVEDAIALGIQELCFTDHVDYGVKRDWDDPRPMLYRPGELGEEPWMMSVNVDYPRYVEQIRQLQQKYQGRIRLALGMEFGMQRHTIADFEKLFARYPFDFIILSVHQAQDKAFWCQHFQQGKTQQEYNEAYYQEILAVAKAYQNYSVLGHLDAIGRYDLAGEYPFEKVKPFVVEILRTAIENGKGIEINTSSQRYGRPDLTPSVEILKLYRDMGGTILTIGSDAHKKEHLGAYIPQVQAQARELGFRYHCTFRNMEPIFHKL